MTPIVDGLERKYGRHLRVVYATIEEQEGKELARQHGIIGYPTFLFLNSQGERTYLLRGIVPQPILEQTVEDLLAAEP